MRNIVLTALALGVGAGAVRAQENEFDDPFGEADSYIVDVFYPKLFVTPKEGLGAGLHYALIKDLDEFDFGVSPASYEATLAFNGHLTTAGSRHASLVFAAPALADGWRFYMAVRGSRFNRDNYHGVGNTTTYDGSLVTDAQPRFYQVQRDLIRVRGEAQREIIPEIRVLVGFNYDRTRLSPLSGPSVFASDVAAGRAMTGSFAADFTSRFGLIFDTRDNEVSPRRGVLVEAILGVSDAGFLSDASFTRSMVSARGYVPATDLLSFAGRFLVQSMGGSPPVTSYYMVEESDRTFTGLGSARSHRAIRHNRLLGRNKLLANAEARYILYGIPTLYTVTAVGFLDVGRVFEPEPLSLTLDGTMAGGGGGLFFQLGPRLVVGSSVGVGPDGVIGNFHTQWPF